MVFFFFCEYVFFCRLNDGGEKIKEHDVHSSFRHSCRSKVTVMKSLTACFHSHLFVICSLSDIFFFSSFFFLVGSFSVYKYFI